jgi:hypothetical protein
VCTQFCFLLARALTRAQRSLNLLAQGKNFIIPLSKQVEQFATVQGNISARIGSGAADGALSRSLFLTSTGGNDLFAFFARNNTPTDAEKRLFIRNLVALYQNHVRVRSPSTYLFRATSIVLRSYTEESY